MMKAKSALLQAILGSVWLCSTGLLVACGEGSEGKAPGGSGGAGGAPGVVQPQGWDTCPEGFDERAEVDVEFARAAGTYSVTFPEGMGETCRADEASFVAGKDYALVVSESDRSFSIETESGTLVRAWDGERDIICAGSVVWGLEIEDETSVVRLSFTGTKPRDLVVGLCVGDVTRPE